MKRVFKKKHTQWISYQRDEYKLSPIVASQVNTLIYCYPANLGSKQIKTPSM